MEYDELPNNIPAEIKEIISDCLKKNPKDRPKVKTILNHKLF